jgi:hypothetical protein
VIVCKQCGHHNEDSDTFCGSCGKFLEWTGERVAVAQPEPEPPAPEPEPEPARLGLIDRVKQAVGLEESPVQSAAPAHPESAPAPGTASAPAPVSAAPPPPASGAPTPAPRVVWSVPVTSATPAAPSATPAAPVPATTPAPEPVLAGVGAPAATAPAPPPVAPVEEPISRRPISVAPAVARPRTAPRVLEAPTRRHPGDLICGQCGEGNDPVRHFCRRCGNSLDEALTVRLPWYRRFFNRVFGIRTREAGWRPRRVGPPNVIGVVWRIIRLAILAVIAVGLLAFLLVPSFHTTVVDRVTAAVTAIRKAVHPNYDPVTPISATASSAIANHPPMLAIDRYSNTYWAALASDHAPVLVIHFSGTQDLNEIGFRSGASGSAPADAFLTQPRPHVVHLVFSNGYATDTTLKDQDATQPQFYPIEDGKATKVTFVEIHVMSIYAPAGASVSSVAITEVEFKTKD